MIVVLDCNIWISLTINRQIDFIAELSDNGVVIASCSTLRNEIDNVLNRPKFSKLISKDTIGKVIRLHDLVTTNFRLTKIPDIVSDPNDNYLFALSVKAKANYLVTGDKLVLDIEKYKAVQVISMSVFRDFF